MTDGLRKLMELDYENTLAFLDKEDSFLITIKNWAITTNGAVFAFAIQSKTRIFLIVNLGINLCFWLLELFYKCFHEDALAQSYLIEEIFYSEPELNDDEIKRKYTFGLGHTIKPTRWRKIFKIIFSRSRFHMSFLYLMLLILTMIGFMFWNKFIN